ncbi:MAG: hypothetical protein N4A53_06115 [Pelagimonas sp.]|jgi:hypothetical protein|nr:hypothetical protein [Pelagimonas sp.]
MGLLDINNTRQVPENSGLSIPYGQLYVYVDDTETLAPLYSDNSLTFTRENPMEADPSGSFPTCYLADGVYRLEFHNQFDQLVLSLPGVVVNDSLDETAGAGFPDFPTVTDLLNNDNLQQNSASEPNYIEPGSLLNVTTGDISYRVTPSGAGDEHLATDGGLKLYVNLNRYELKAEAFGVKFSGDPLDAANNAQAVQEALDWLHGEGQGGRLSLASEGHMVVNAPIAMRSGLHLDGAGSLVENVLTAADGQGHLSQTCLVLGSWATQDDNDYTWRRLKSVDEGDIYIEAANNGTAWTQVGHELVFVNATANNVPTSSFGDGVDGQGGGNGDYDSLQTRVVTRIEGSRIYLDLPVTEGMAAGSGTLADVNDPATGGWVVDASWDSVDNTRRNGLIDRGARHVISRFTVSDLHLKAQSGVVMQRGGMHRGQIERISVRPADTVHQEYGFVANLMSWTKLRDWESPFWTRAVEIAGGSSYSDLSGLRIFQHQPPGVSLPTQEHLIRICGENSRHITVHDSQFELGILQDSVSMLRFSGGAQSVFRNNSVTGQGASAAITFDEGDWGHFVLNNRFRGTAVTGIDLRGQDNRVAGNVMEVTTTGKNLRVNAEADGCQASGNDLRDGIMRVDADPAPGNRASVLRNNRGVVSIERSGRAVIAGNSSSNWEELGALIDAWDDGATNFTSSSTLGMLHDALVIPAGMLEPGTRLNFDFEGEKVGTNGFATLRLVMAIDDDEDDVDIDGDDSVVTLFNWSFGNNANLDVAGGVNVTMQNSTSIEFGAWGLTSGPSYANSAAPGGLNLTGKPLRFEWRGSTSSGAELRLHRIRLKAERRGYVSVGG